MNFFKEKKMFKLYIVGILKSIWSAIINLSMILVAIVFGPKNYVKIQMIYQLSLFTGKNNLEAVKDLKENGDYFLQHPDQFFLKYML